MPPKPARVHGPHGYRPAAAARPAPANRSASPSPSPSPARSASPPPAAPDTDATAVPDANALEGAFGPNPMPLSDQATDANAPVLPALAPVVLPAITAPAEGHDLPPAPADQLPGMRFFKRAAKAMPNRSSSLSYADALASEDSFLVDPAEEPMAPPPLPSASKAQKRKMDDLIAGKPKPKPAGKITNPACVTLRTVLHENSFSPAENRELKRANYRIQQEARQAQLDARQALEKQQHQQDLLQSVLESDARDKARRAAAKAEQQQLNEAHRAELRSELEHLLSVQAEPGTARLAALERQVTRLVDQLAVHPVPPPTRPQAPPPARPPTLLTRPPVPNPAPAPTRVQFNTAPIAFPDLAPPDSDMEAAQAPKPRRQPGPIAQAHQSRLKASTSDSAPKRAKGNSMATVVHSPPVSEEETTEEDEPPAPPRRSQNPLAQLSARAAAPPPPPETGFTAESSLIPFATPDMLRGLEANNITFASLKADPIMAKAVRKAMTWLKWYWSAHRRVSWVTFPPSLTLIARFIMWPEFQAASVQSTKNDARSWYEVSGWDDARVTDACCTHQEPRSSARHSGASTGPHLTPYDASSSTDSDSTSDSGPDSDSDSETDPSATSEKSANPSENPGSPSSSDTSSPSSSSDPDSVPPPSPPKSKAALKRAEKRKRQRELPDAVARIEDPKTSKPTRTTDAPSERDRKLNLEFRKSMTAFTPKVSDYTKQKDLERWCTEIEEAARVHYGPDWQQNPEVIYGAVLAMENELKDMWRDNHKRHPNDPLTWPRLLSWIKAHVDREVRSESRDALQLLIDGKYQQGGKAVYRYLNHFRRITSKIPDTSESQLIQFFLNGMSLNLKPECLTDIKGKPWKTLDALVKHAAAQELKLKARNAPAPSTRNDRGGSKNPTRRTLALAAKKKAKAAARKTRAGRRHTNGTSDHPTDKSLAAAMQAPSQAQRPQGGRPQGGGRDGGRVEGGGQLTGDDSAPFRYNKKISEQQARYLSSTQRCWHCYEPQAACKADRADPSKCNLKGNSVPLAKGAHGGAPAFKGN